MENPTAEIRHVVHTLCTRPHAEQQAALAKYFLPDAEFVHPLCRVPALKSKRLPSRRIVAAVFRWYKLMSPHIVLAVESVAWDRDSNTLFVALRQRFALWCVPLYAAHVRLVTELQLVAVAVAVEEEEEEEQEDEQDNISHTRYYIARQEDHYQVNEILKFFSMGLGAAAWYVVQVLATAASVVGVLVVDTLLGLVPGGLGWFE